MKGAKSDAGRVKRPYKKRARPQAEQSKQQQGQLRSYELTTGGGGGGGGGGGASGYPAHVTEVVDDQQVGHLPLPQPIHGDELQERVDDLGDSWETESIFEDIIDDLTQDTFSADVDACTPEQSVAFRQQLRAIGPNAFCRLHIDSGAVTARKMLTAFGIRPPDFLEGRPDEAYLGLLTLAITRELNKRAKIMSYNSIDDAVHLLKKSRNIVVLTGAGISTSLGIPDFRSKETGLYSQLEKLGLGINDPQEVFNIDVFRDDPTIFYTVAKDILPATKKFSPTHAFIAMLQNQGKLLTNYSQNIDNIEANAGIRPEKLVQCHGSFATASCQRCRHKVRGDTIFDDIKAGRIPRCGKCITALRAKGIGPPKRKRSSNSSSSKKSRRSFDDFDDDDDDGAYDIPQAGVMKPDITFFGEPLPDEFSKRLVKHDRNLVDLVIVIGTSLKVAPVSEVVPFLPPHIPQIYISRTPVSHINFDIDLLGDCDIVVAELCRRAGWDLNHPMVPPNQRIDISLEPGYNSRHIFTLAEDPKPDLDPVTQVEEAPQPVKQRRSRNSSSHRSDGLAIAT
ncbi:DHS-like NAD/FAD-binding domain-containing protein [Xylaria bambusicola]|uniref:DHS-like NAD/FAD-binding domain-containing protein n=1 Tax=Xylaria bambusicola TaxID=326684 RepID=UPI002008C3D2|nr:DHS-like NAD/FAD-binding domain-containing protein [Xylaria bambusicola]KAI0518100.1 DHS-like NAD/FAD-binding domain-containing protein [Xylaria bambusicola]